MLTMHAKARKMMLVLVWRVCAVMTVSVEEGLADLRYGLVALFVAVWGKRHSRACRFCLQ
jgi:hypothetical protein